MGRKKSGGMMNKLVIDINLKRKLTITKINENKL